MKLTLDYIKTNFDKFNEKYFDGCLVTPKFKIVHAKSYLGRFAWKIVNGGKPDYTISISGMFDRSDKDFCNTIIHEMIHLYIHQYNVIDNGSHGRVFKRIAKRINADGWNISRCGNVTGCGLSSKKTVTYNLVTFLSHDGKYFLMRYNRSKQSYFMRVIMKYHYRDVVWFNSTDDVKYASFTECKSAFKGRYITKEEHDEIEKSSKYSCAV